MAAKLLEPIHPGEILREEFMKPMQVSINALSREIAVPPNRVSDIVNGKRSITADTALNNSAMLPKASRGVALRPARVCRHARAKAASAAGELSTSISIRFIAISLSRDPCAGTPPSSERGPEAP